MGDRLCHLRNYILFENYIFNLPKNNVYNNFKEFTKDIGVKSISRKYLVNIYSIIPSKIMTKMNKYG